VGEDVYDYEYEEGVPEEEAGKNGRYDAAAKYEFDIDAYNAVRGHSLLLAS
jgi:U3 small nucleolar RNA-associated protein 14